jgi:fibronectin type 3 domain-containing protein
MPTVSVANASAGVTVKWTKSAGATGYYVYRKTTDGWTKVATIKGNSTVSYTDKTAKSGTTYKYTVRAYSGSTQSYYNTAGVAIKFLSAPTLKSVTSAKSGVTFKWNKVTGATGYIVYRKTGNGGWQKIATVKTNSYLDKTAKKGVTYKYTVKAYYGTSTSYYNTKGLTIKDKY